MRRSSQFQPGRRRSKEPEKAGDELQALAAVLDLAREFAAEAQVAMYTELMSHGCKAAFVQL